MSYEIIYQRAFIKTTRGIIATVLAGSNNCTVMTYDCKGRRREVRERSWFPIYSQELLEKPAEDIQKWLSENPSQAEYELFRFHGNWVYGNQEQKWFSAGCKDARTVEDYLQWNPTQSIYCRVRVNRCKQEWRPTEELAAFCRTTEYLEAWIDKAKALKAAYLRDNPSGECYIHIGFTGEKTIKVVPNRQGPVVAKQGSSFVVGYHKDKSIVTSADAKNAIVFESADKAAVELRCFLETIKFVKAESALQTVNEMPFVIGFTGGSLSGRYAVRRTRSKLYSSFSVQGAKRFATKSKARRWALGIYGRYSASAVGTLQICNLTDGSAENIECKERRNT